MGEPLLRSDEQVADEAGPGSAAPAGAAESAVRVVPRLWQALREVNDPELPISIVDLGLVYALRYRNGTAEVDLTYTATGCPCTHFIKWDVAERLQREPEVRDVRITEVWDPPWTKARVSSTGRRRLKDLGVSV